MRALRRLRLLKKGEEGLKNLELDIAALRHAVIHRLDNSRVGTGGEGGELRVIVADLAFELRNNVPCASHLVGTGLQRT